jgi:hypothetical protein
LPRRRDSSSRWVAITTRLKERDEGGRDRDGGRKEKRERKGEKRRIGEGGRDALAESDVIFICSFVCFYYYLQNI